MLYQRRTPEQGHTKQCMAKAVIAAVENLRDDSNESDIGFRLDLQANQPMFLADDYLETGLADCICPVEWIKFGDSGMARCPNCSATDWLSNFQHQGCSQCGLK